MRVMAVQATVPEPHTSRPHPEHCVYPYLLRDLAIERPNHSNTERPHQGLGKRTPAEVHFG